MQTSKQPIIELDGVWKAFKKQERQDLLVLENINFSLYPDEIVALIGKTGAGKSTLLRIISGLIPPNGGQVRYQGQMVRKPVPGLSMVFQSFALMPWLTVLQNVELGLEALGVNRKERRSRALKAIDTIGLDGFESAFPKELSGGMRQRVGFARALVVEPDVLLMDEPFSALDVLTAENLRSDLLDIWEAKSTRIKSMIIVTHNIEEAVMMADRIVIFGSDPGSIMQIIPVDIPQPRYEQENKIREYVDAVYTQMAQHTLENKVKKHAYKVISLGYRLPDVEVSELSGLIEDIGTSIDHEENSLQALSEKLHLDIDELLALSEVLDILRFASITDGSINPTPAGLNFAQADILEKKEIFSTHLLNYVPLARHIRRVLDDRPGYRAKRNRFLNELEDYLSESEAERVLTTVIEWGRYAEIFAYDSNTDELSLENPK